jgi:hypothetical protein
LHEKELGPFLADGPGKLYGRLMMVFTMVVDANKASALPVKNVVADVVVLFAGLESVVAAVEMMVPTIVPPPP